MPKVMTPEAIASALVGSSVVSQIRTLTDSIRDSVTVPPLDWSDDLKELGIEPTTKLSSPFSTVASEATGEKYRAVVKILKTGEVAIRFNKVKSRD